jgi:hypothetical protein
MPHSRRLLGFNARSWVLASAILIAAALSVPPPGAPADPSEGLFRDPILISRTPSGDKVVPFGQHEGMGPVWAVSLWRTDTSTINRRLGVLPGSRTPGFGFFRRNDHWRYELAANRFDRGARSAPSKDLWLSPEDAKSLRPVVVAELERRSGGAHQGVLLEHLLDHGASRESWANWQNGLVLLAWLSIPVTLWAVARAIRTGKDARLAKRMVEYYA